MNKIKMKNEQIKSIVFQLFVFTNKKHNHSLLLWLVLSNRCYESIFTSNGLRMG